VDPPPAPASTPKVVADEVPPSKPSLGSASVPASAPEGVAPPAVEPAAPPMTPKDRLFALLLPRLSEDKKHAALWSAVVGNAEAQRQLLSLLLSTEDRELLEAGQDLLISMRDPELVKQLVSAFAEEKDPDRKAMLAYALGGNFKNAEAQPSVEAILAGGDSALQERALTRLSVQEASGEIVSRMVPQLRDLVLNGATSNVRSRAAGALRGDVSEDGVRFLVDRALKDSDPAVQLRALQALPGTWRSPAPLPELHVETYWTLVNDEGRSVDVRRYAANRLLYGGVGRFQKFTEEQTALLKSLTEKKN
jgi:hypothetical protein